MGFNAATFITITLPYIDKVNNKILKAQCSHQPVAAQGEHNSYNKTAEWVSCGLHDYSRIWGGQRNVCVSLGGHLMTYLACLGY